MSFKDERSKNDPRAELKQVQVRVSRLRSLKLWWNQCDDAVRAESAAADTDKAPLLQAKAAMAGAELTKRLAWFQKHPDGEVTVANLPDVCRSLRIMEDRERDLRDRIEAELDDKAGEPAQTAPIEEAETPTLCSENDLESGGRRKKDAPVKRSKRNGGRARVAVGY